MTRIPPHRESIAPILSRQIWHLEGKILCAEAQRRTGLSDFGDPPIEPALSALTKSLEQEANLHPLGRFLMRSHLRGLIETRLQLTDLWKGEMEELEASPVTRPIFITGMPRSGSTFLHELLLQDSALRAPRVWEVMFPAAATDPDRALKNLSLWSADWCLWLFRQLAPKADSVHPIRARSPQECVAIHSYSFLSEEFVATCRVPGYEAFLRSSDLRPAYAWEKRFLQHLQRGSRVDRWVLKSPDHVYGMEALFSIFPDALIVQIHRDPLEVLRSSIQLVEVLQGLFARPGDRQELAAHEARNLASAMERFVEFRDAHPEIADRFLDVNYGELVADPLAVVRLIYERFQLPMTVATGARIDQLGRSRSRYSGRRTASTLGELGLNVRELAGQFKRYCSRFGIPCRTER